jgi:antitoxin MazE
MQIAKWGNSLAVRLPAKLVEELGLKEGDEVEITKGSGRTLALQRVLDRLEILKELRKFRGVIPADFKFDRDEANER